MIVIYPPQTPVDKTLLKGSAKANPDGFGFLIYTNPPHKLTIPETLPGVKSVDDYHIIATYLTFEQALGQFEQVKQLNPGAHAVFHARKATLGPKDLLHTHPYQTIDGHWVFHNGIFPGYGSDHTSDTADYLQKHSGQPGWIQKFIDDLGTGRAVLFDPQTKKAKIVGFEAGQNINGVLYSNTSYTGTPDPV